MANFTFIDLFAGIGGFRIALNNAGGTCLGFSEIAPDAIHAYCENFKESELKNFGDITKIKYLPECDFITAGVPCQSWSIAGKKLGFDDDRGQLWNDTLFLLNKVHPKAFIFENVKGLADPRNKEALNYIMARIKEAGYYAEKYILNANDYGSLQNRVRIYIVGFREEQYFKRFKTPIMHSGMQCLRDFANENKNKNQKDLLAKKPCRSLSYDENGFNDYFLFNDLRDGKTTIHSWDIIETTDKEKHICELLLKNRRKHKYGILDGNALSLSHFVELDPTIQKSDLETLVDKTILKHVPYQYKYIGNNIQLSKAEELVLSFCHKNYIIVDELKLDKCFKIQKIKITDIIKNLVDKGVLECSDLRYDFKNAKISTGLNGINRIFLRSSKVYPTMVASDTNDYIATVDINANTLQEYKREFMEKIYYPQNYRQITKEEACLIQGFPGDFILPEARQRWMKLIGNSVDVTLVKMIVQSVVNTGVFSEENYVKD